MNFSKLSVQAGDEIDFEFDHRTRLRVTRVSIDSYTDETVVLALTTSHPLWIGPYAGTTGIEERPLATDDDCICEQLLAEWIDG